MKARTEQTDTLPYAPLIRIAASSMFAVTRYEYRAWLVEGRLAASVNAGAHFRKRRAWRAVHPDGKVVMSATLRGITRLIDVYTVSAKVAGCG